MKDSIDFTFLPPGIADLCRMAYAEIPMRRDHELIEAMTLVYGYGQLVAQNPEGGFNLALSIAAMRLAAGLRKKKSAPLELTERLNQAINAAGDLRTTHIPHVKSKAVAASSQ